jgi:hypothetical protein
MPVLTRADYAKRTEVKPRSFQLPPPEKVVAGETRPSPSRVYVLAYPEPPMIGAANFEFRTVVDGQIHHVHCINGVVRTEEKALRDYLVGSKGYLELEVKELSDENQN